MKRTETKDLKSKSMTDLITKVHQLKKEQAEMLIEASLGKLKNVHKVRAKKKEIAQALTFLALKNFEQQSQKARKLEEIKEKQK